MSPTAHQAEAEAADWISRRDSGAWTDDDQRALDYWVGESTLNRVSYLRLDAVWKRADRLAAVPAASLPSAASAGLHRSSVLRRVASAAALAVGLAMLTLPMRDSALSQNKVATDLGERRYLALTDGSSLALNTNTLVGTDVSREHRRVELERGEALFDVAHDSARPFVVQAGGHRVEVLGTRFSMHRSPDGSLSVAVAQGRVRLASAGGQAVLLQSGDTAKASDDGIDVVRKTPEQIAHMLSWQQGELVFDGMSVAQAVAEFNRYNHRKLVVSDPDAAAMSIGGRFDVRNVDGFARLLEQGFGLTVRSEADRIVIGAARTGF